jgi:hypothetical protein
MRIGSCKLPHFQHANYNSNVIEDCKMIHVNVNNFLLRRERNAQKEKDV